MNKRVKISLGNNSKIYDILTIDKNVIFLKTSDPNFLGAIVFENNSWKVYGDDDKPYIIEFLEDYDKSFITKSKDIDILTLSYLDNASLFSACLTNKSINSICSDENFWKQRVFEHYPNADKFISIKNKTWRQYYRFLDSLKLGDFESDILKMEEETLRTLFSKYIMNNDLEIVSYILSIRKILPNPDAFFSLMKNPVISLDPNQKKNPMIQLLEDNYVFSFPSKRSKYLN